MIHRKYSGGTLPDDHIGRSTVAPLEAERIEFIRRTAIAIVGSLPSTAGIGTTTWAEAWRCAEGLWDTKPEDC